jgi:hypothetical protein
LALHISAVHVTFSLRLSFTNRLPVVNITAPQTHGNDDAIKYINPPFWEMTVQSFIVTGLHVGRKGNRILFPGMDKRFPYKVVTVRLSVNFILGKLSGSIKMRGIS